ncbi:MAG TPA: LuxR C-terminal-related transcriptional regulator [Streptosporangiaceae bacterium]|nr:LuxR C-terminal-related transcriptional regulator [Streptosporangiaceae bacterium]
MRQDPARASSGGPSRPGRSLRAVPAGGWVERSALVERLTATEAKLILIEAPAGYGKTILAAQWRAHTVRARPFAWISLGEDDNEPRKLWRHITHALLRACPELEAGQILCHLRGSSPDITGAAIPSLVNELAGLAVPAVLVLDDYHSITEPGCHEQMTFLLHHLPASVQVVLVTRADPPLPLARWRATGELAEFRAHDLAFTAAEAGPVVSALSGVELSESDLATLVGRTEGWPTGLYLAAVDLRGHRSPAAFVRQFSGASASIAGFLAEEALGRQPAAIRRFLARTSILDRFCAPLCDAVTGSADAAEMLATLERENAFLVPLDQSRQWFRYHHLLAQALRDQLEATEPGLVPVLHRRASAWYRQSGLADGTIEHTIAAGDRAGAIDLIASYWHPYVASGRTATVRGWVRGLGDRAIGGDPVAAHCAAWSAVASGDREPVRRWLPVMAASTRPGPLPDGMQSLESSVALLQGLCGFDGLEAMRRSAEWAVELESDASQPWYALARTVLGFSRYLSGDAAGAEKPLLEAVANAPLTPAIHLLSLSTLSLALSELGQLTRAQRAADLAISLMSGSNLGRTPPASLAHAAAGAAHAGLGRLPEARSELEHALRARRRRPGISAWATIDIMLVLTKVLIDLGDRSSAAVLAGEVSLLLTAAPDDTHPLRARLERLERRLEGRSPARALADPLTEREVTVLRLLRSALSRREIAAALNLSENTIKTQVTSIYGKLGVSARGDAIARGQQLGIL